MKRHSLVAVLAVLALPASAHAATFALEAGSPFPTRYATYAITVNDFNGDGLLDVAAVNGRFATNSDSVSIYLRQPGGGFVEEPGSPISVPQGPNSIASGDFGGDSRADLAIATFEATSVSLLVRNATNDGFVSGGSPGFVPGGGSALAAADFDGNGALDLAYGSWRDSTVGVLRRQGTGFVDEQPNRYPVVANPRQLAPGDFDGDGRPDLAVTNAGDDSVSILIRSQDGSTFAAEDPVPVGAEPWGIAAGDFNRDGRLDLAVANEGGDSVQLLVRNGSNDGFTATSPVAVPDQPRDIAVADFDSNGSPDVAVASLGAGALTVLSGGTTPEPSIALASAYTPAVGDFNRDGRPDLAVSSAFPGSFSSFLNTTAPPQQPPPPQPPQPPAPTPTPLPEPVAGRNVNATPVEGRVRVRLPGSRAYVDLAQTQRLPVGTTVDARNGTVELRAANNGGTAKFFDGIFRISSQTRGSRPLTTLTLTEQLSCPRSKRASAAAQKKKSRKLWGDGKGAFRTSGRYSAATVRGTKWLVTDRCDTTTTRVTQGSVTVRDFVKKRNVVVRAGKSNRARKRR
ncbi:FG-GAP repeat domain-containing protein [Solirubrobacter deserti]|uniref:VCBS repeat-containing protein n=1 Tax=Solirubrobacter deserti TaxID=2282478 RepID=A0ABT4RDQ0_9ACTN|nr:VCBS repeat-containing protein [Solirubrobacter deserti]MDA0136665.1 VCBS repeat-containing protein [Solirubrobacter deserti]